MNMLEVLFMVREDLTLSISDYKLLIKSLANTDVTVTSLARLFVFQKNIGAYIYINIRKMWNWSPTSNAANIN